MAKRRIDSPEKNIKRIEANGDWVEIKITMSYEQFMECQEPERVVDKQKLYVHKLLTAWSFIGEDGQPLPVTPENIEDNFDAEIFIDTIAEIGRLPFFQRMLARVNQDS